MWNNCTGNRRRVPQRGGKSRATAPVVSGVYGRRIRWGLICTLVLLGICLILSPTLQGRLRGVIMLFSQKSVHTLAGALRSAGPLALPYVLFLTVFRAAVLPWMLPLLPLADSMVFGTAVGFAVSLIAALLAGSACFWVSRLLLRETVFRLEPPQAGCAAARWGGVWCCAALLVFPGTTGFVGYLSGMLGLSYRRYLAGAVAGEAIVLLAILRCCSPFQTLLPDTSRMCLALAGLAALAACLGVAFRTPKK